MSLVRNPLPEYASWQAWTTPAERLQQIASMVSEFNKAEDVHRRLTGQDAAKVTDAELYEAGHLEEAACIGAEAVAWHDVNRAGDYAPEAYNNPFQHEDYKSEELARIYEASYATRIHELRVEREIQAIRDDLRQRMGLAPEEEARGPRP